MQAPTSPQRKPSSQSQRSARSALSAHSSRPSHNMTREAGQSGGQRDGTPTQSQRRASLNASAHSAQSKWWHVHLFRGMVNDIKRRAPYYWSDWTDAWDYRVVPATVYMYFAKYARSAT
ncbi:hypothetical protein N7535_001025 [Penicillium sp. DV-2018c]|nr:hypothetical protein N7535_001025 [Penicillium sp. DV-2018c]